MAEKLKDPKEAEKKAASTHSTAGKDKALSTDDLDKVSGGLNPQPLPPIDRTRQ